MQLEHQKRLVGSANTESEHKGWHISGIKPWMQEDSKHAQERRCRIVQKTGGAKS